ncbi:hypothetical protein [Cyanobium sp. Tous-M-B4]|uniref:hypothetical protein n=1 Tax=Cyanobium sp. Tous-M-B4 TaxID=2823724 RepID=UPI0020CC8319|nr:hypothetical protein [Cyanobium sp. Tous-M-B4]MCP9777424.1 hypothetical protein [Cyanobium sp. Tous-M-B4]
MGWLNFVGQVDAVSASLLRRVSRVAVINCLEVPWRLIRQVLQRLMGLLITAVAMQVLVNGPEAASRSWPERGWEGQRMSLASS